MQGDRIVTTPAKYAIKILVILGSKVSARISTAQPKLGC
jgi:hypothetical protein